MSSESHILTSLESVRAVLGESSPATEAKVMDRLDETSLEFIERSPFLLLATADETGAPDVSPKGDLPGFVRIENDRTLLIPDRKGNRLIFGLKNILANPQISVIFLLPGTGETLRVSGRAEITKEPELLESLVDERGNPAMLAIRLRIEKTYFHCAKALVRSHLWQPEHWQEPYRVSFGRIMAKKLGGGAELEKKIDEAVEESYRTQL